MAGEQKPLIHKGLNNAGTSDVRIICRVCQKQWSKYACPRCNVRYCSLPCYKAHSSRCTEGFYRENAEEELRQKTADPEDRRKMLQTLRRMQEAEDEEMSEASEEMDGRMSEGSDEEGEETEEGGASAKYPEEGFEFSEETLRRLSEKGGALSLDDLTPTERAALRQAAASGALSRYIPVWEPWYLSPEAKHIRISPTGTRAVREIVSQPGGSQTPAEEAFDRLMGGGGRGPGERGLGTAQGVDLEGSPSEASREESTDCLERTGDEKNETDKRHGSDVAEVSASVEKQEQWRVGDRVPSSEGHLTPAADEDSIPEDDVSRMDDDVSTGNDDVSGPGIPPPPDADLPPLSSLTRNPPSPLLGCHVTAVMYAYCYVMRLFNGEWHVDPPNAADTLVAVCPVLSDGATPMTVDDALHGCLTRACSPLFAGSGGTAFARGLLGDVSALLALGRPGVVCALADVQRMLIAAKYDQQAVGTSRRLDVSREARGGAVEREEKGGAEKESGNGRERDAPRGSEERAERRSSASRVDNKVQSDAGGKPGQVNARVGSSKTDARTGVGERGKAKQLPELVRRKVLFFLVWANEQSDTVFLALAAAVNERFDTEKRHEFEQEGGRIVHKPDLVQEM